MAMPADQIEGLVSEALPGARVTATDLTGTQDHWKLEVSWAGFEGMTLLDQHRKVMDILKPHMEGVGSGAVHAVEIATSAGAPAP